MSDADHPSAPPDLGELYALKVLEGVSLSSVSDLLESCEVRTLAPGEVLLSLGQTNRVMYMVLHGRLSVHLESAASDPVAFLQTGETVGELSVIDDRPASAYVVAAERSRLLAVDEGRFWRLVEASHDFSVNLLLLLARRLRANNSTVSDNMRLSREYQKNAMSDALTGLYNRRWLDDALPRFTRRHERSGRPLALLMIDIDHFKRINDGFGHPAGDQVLAAVARSLREALRPQDPAVRYGGEEFAVILADSDRDAACAVAERLRVVISELVLKLPGGEPLPPVTISVGVATLVAGAADALLVAADDALYTSKREGRNRVTAS